MLSCEESDESVDGGAALSAEPVFERGGEPVEDVSEEVGAAQAATSRANVAPNAAQRQRLPMVTF